MSESDPCGFGVSSEATGSTTALPATASAAATAASATTAATATTTSTAAAAALAPRAGFWIRAGALLIDVMIVWAAAAFLLMGKSAVGLFAIYCIVMWALRGTTLGGLVCGLKIVRADGTPLTWTTALARALGGFVAMLPIGLGFIWVAIDSDRQGWHDKIAGTIVVRAPKGQSLV